MTAELTERIRARLAKEQERVRAFFDGHPETVVACSLPSEPSEEGGVYIGGGWAERREALATWSWTKDAGLPAGHLAHEFASNWPKDLPDPLTGQAAIEFVDAHLDDMAADLSRMIEAAGALLIESDYVGRALARSFLTDMWPWPVHSTPSTTAAWFARYAASSEPITYSPPSDEKPQGSIGPAMDWHAGAKPQDVALWAKDALDRVTPKLGTNLYDVTKRYGIPPHVEWTTADGHIVLLPSMGLALLFLAEQDVKEGQQRHAVHIDTDRPHTDFMAGLTELPKDGEPHDWPDKDGHLQLFAPGKAVQLEFPNMTATEAMVEALHLWQGFPALRTWAGLLVQLSEQGATGTLVWSLDDHLKACGYSPRARRKGTIRQDEAARVEALVNVFQLRWIDRTNRVRHRFPVFQVDHYIDHPEGDRWQLGTIEMHINRQLLYRGVRNHRTGKLGTNWYPAPTAIAGIDHRHKRHALALALLLPGWFSLAWRENHRAHVDRRGDTLLGRARIPYDRRKAGRAWKALRDNLDELVRVGQLERWEWRRNPETMAGVARLYAADWLVDRTVGGLEGRLPAPAPSINTGADLKAHRKAKGWTQQQAAEALGVSRDTVGRAERAPKKRLPRSILKALGG